MSIPAIDRVVDEAVSERRIVGTVVLLARDGECIHRRAAGWADRERGGEVREHTLFRLASISKLVTTAAALRLIDQGLLRLDDAVDDWLPGFEPRTVDGRLHRITVKHLLTHGAGLDYGFLQPADGAYRRLAISSGLDGAGPTLTETLLRLGQAPLNAVPGTRWGYSMATDVLGAVLAVCTGLELPRALHALIVEPLGLSDLAFVARDPERLAVPYANTGSGPVPMSEPHRLDLSGIDIELSPARALDPRAFPSGGAGMVGNAGDVLAVIECLRQGRLVSHDLWQAFGQPCFGAEAQSLGSGWGFGLGAAVLVDPVAAATALPAGTLSWGGVYGNNWFVLPEQRLTLVALTNTTPEGANGRFVRELREALARVARA